MSARLSKWRPLSNPEHALKVSFLSSGEKKVHGKGEESFMLNHLALSNLAMTFPTFWARKGENLKISPEKKFCLGKFPQEAHLCVKIVNCYGRRGINGFDPSLSLGTNNQIYVYRAPLQAPLTVARTYFSHNRPSTFKMFPLFLYYFYYSSDFV